MQAIGPQIRSFMDGFYEVIPHSLISLFDEYELVSSLKSCMGVLHLHVYTCVCVCVCMYSVCGVYLCGAVCGAVRGSLVPRILPNFLSHTKPGEELGTRLVCGVRVLEVGEECNDQHTKTDTALPT